MAYREIDARVKIRRDTSTNFAKNNPILLAGELAIEQDTNKVKIGNGTTIWTKLPYLLDMDYIKGLISELQEKTKGAFIPIGSVMYLPTASIPSAYASNWKVCNGSTVYKSTYPELFSNLGWTGSSHALPNLIDSRFIEGGTSVLTYKKEGLPNIKGGFTVDDSVFDYDEGGTGTRPFGCFTIANNIRYKFDWDTGSGNYADTCGTMLFDASRSGIELRTGQSNDKSTSEWTTIYSDDVKTVQPRSLVLLPIIRVK